jgi:hypothetical protein
MPAMNHSLMTADRGTHVRVVLVSLASVLAFIVTFVGFQVTQDASVTPRLDGPALIKSVAPTAVASRDLGRAMR